MPQFARSSWLLLFLIIAAGAAKVGGMQQNSPAVDERRLPAARVHIHPDVLTGDDALSDGDGKKSITITSPTTLVWIDRMPGARFEHPTEYVLISAKETRVIKGGWWPVLNGKRLFGDDAAGRSIKMPISLIDPTRRDEP